MRLSSICYSMDNQTTSSGCPWRPEKGKCRASGQCVDDDGDEPGASQPWKESGAEWGIGEEQPPSISAEKGVGVHPVELGSRRPRAPEAGSRPA